MEAGKESNHKPNKLWVDQGKEFYNILLKKQLDNNDILMYPTNNEGMSVMKANESNLILVI